MKSVILFAGVVAAGKVGTVCTADKDCDTAAKGDLAEVCQTTKIAIIETKVCSTKKACDAAAKNQVAGTTVSCEATYLAAAATLLALGSQL